MEKVIVGLLATIASMGYICIIWAECKKVRVAGIVVSGSALALAWII